MKLTWYGHACFKLETAEGRAVFDPYEDNFIPRMTMPETSADAVFCSHGHGDHNAEFKVKLSGKTPAFKVSRIPCFHDEVMGRKRGSNLITVIEAEGRKIAHMGDIGHLLNDEQLKALEGCDLLMIPVGGFFTVDAENAKKICDAVKPKVTVPMHYKCGRAGLQAVAPVDDFLALFDKNDILRLGTNTWEISEISQTAVVFELC